MYSPSALASGEGLTGKRRRVDMKDSLVRALLGSTMIDSAFEKWRRKIFRHAGKDAVEATETDETSEAIEALLDDLIGPLFFLSDYPKRRFCWITATQRMLDQMPHLELRQHFANIRREARSYLPQAEKTRFLEAIQREYVCCSGHLKTRCWTGGTFLIGIVPCAVEAAAHERLWQDYADLCPYNQHCLYLEAIGTLPTACTIFPLPSLPENTDFSAMVDAVLPGFHGHLHQLLIKRKPSTSVAAG